MLSRENCTVNYENSIEYEGVMQRTTQFIFTHLVCAIFFWPSSSEGWIALGTWNLQFRNAPLRIAPVLFRFEHYTSKCSTIRICCFQAGKSIDPQPAPRTTREFNVLFQQYAKERNPSAAFELLDAMNQTGSRKDIYTYNALLNVCALGPLEGKVRCLC